MTPVHYLETSVLICGENLVRLSELPSECIDLIYLDPPFFSNRTYEVIWGDEAEVRSFEDRWKGGIHHYIDWMLSRCVELHRVLKPTGSLYLHCDSNASHYLKVMLDGIFAPRNFRSEVIWKRTTAHSSAKRYGPVHDTILYYTRSAKRVWNQPRGPYDPGYLDRYYRFDDGDGRLYWRDNICAAGVRGGSSGQVWRGFDPSAKGMHWKFVTERLDELDAEGRIYWPKGGTGWPQYKRYRDELKGMALSDVWTDIDRINPKGGERLGYPTQKPEALLQRIIEASSNPGDVVLDPFCGCGTTLAVAERTGRRWLGIDISPTAINLVRSRLTKLGAEGMRIEGLPETAAQLRALKPFEFQNWVVQRLHGTHAPRLTGDMGIDGYSFMQRLPIQIKRSDKVGRNVVDNFETAVRRSGETAGYIVAFSFGRGAYEEAARAKSDGLSITLVTVKTLLEAATAAPLPGIDQMLADIYEGVRASLDATPTGPPPVTAETLIKSDLAA